MEGKEKKREIVEFMKIGEVKFGEIIEINGEF